MDIQKRRKTYFSNNGNNQKKRNQFSLEPGMTGFLCTCNFRERDCIRDAYKILNEFADETRGSEDAKEPQADTVSPVEKDESTEPDQVEPDQDDEDISTALDKEIIELKAEYFKPVSARKFQVVDIGAKNLIFIMSNVSNPVELVTKIVTELDSTKKQCSRFLLRLLPIEVVCKANMADIKLKADVLFEKYFAQEPKTFSIVFNRRANNSIHREEVIEVLAELIGKKNPGNKACMKNPELAVVVEVVRGLCLISIAPNYYKFKKYNLLEICNAKEQKEEIKKDNPEETTDKTESKVEDSKEDEELPMETANKKEETTDQSEITA